MQTPMAQGQSTKNISMIKWIQFSRLSVKKSLDAGGAVAADAGGGQAEVSTLNIEARTLHLLVLLTKFTMQVELSRRTLECIRRVEMRVRVLLDETRNWAR